MAPIEFAITAREIAHRVCNLAWVMEAGRAFELSPDSRNSSRGEEPIANATETYSSGPWGITLTTATTGARGRAICHWAQETQSRESAHPRGGNLPSSNKNRRGSAGGLVRIRCGTGSPKRSLAWWCGVKYRSEFWRIGSRRNFLGDFGAFVRCRSASSLMRRGYLLEIDTSRPVWRDPYASNFTNNTHSRYLGRFMSEIKH